MPIPITIAYNAEALESTIAHAALALDNLKDALGSVQITVNDKENK